MRVDLPAPFSPMSTFTLPRYTLKSTLSRATVPPKILRDLLRSENDVFSPPLIGLAPLPLLPLLPLMLPYNAI